MKRSSKASPSAVSRDWELKSANNGMHYSIGGKLTSAREDAAVIVDTVCERLGNTSKCQTENRPFPWAPEHNYPVWSETVHSRSSRVGIDKMVAKWLMRRHGKRVEEILSSLENDPRLAERIVPALPLIYADLLYCARHEMVVYLDDLLRRRMPLMILAKLSEETMHRIATTIAVEVGWEETAIDREVASCLKK